MIAKGQEKLVHDLHRHPAHEAPAADLFSPLGRATVASQVSCKGDRRLPVRFQTCAVTAQDCRFDEVSRQPNQHPQASTRAHLVAGGHDKRVRVAAHSKPEVLRCSVHALHASQLVAKLLDGLGNVRVPALRLFGHPHPAQVLVPAPIAEPPPHLQ